MSVESEVSSGVSKAGPRRAGALPNIQGAHPTPLAKNLGKKGLNINLPVFLYFSLLAKKILGPKVNLEHFSDVLKSIIKVKVRVFVFNCLWIMCARIYHQECTRIALMRVDFSNISWGHAPMQTPLVWVC